jgi:hypothetical protein
MRRLTGVLAAALIVNSAHAQYVAVNATRHFPFPGLGSGPLDLFHVYPFYASQQLLENADYAWIPNEQVLVFY